jgi:regulator of RNase E activity RraA
MNPQETLIARLARIDTSVMSDVLDEAGLPRQALSHELRPLDSRSRVAGVALCAAGRPVIAKGAGGGNPPSMYELERQMTPGRVLVIDASAEKYAATVGGFMAATFKAKGCAGLVVHGAVRDGLELVELGLPAFVRSLTPANSARRWELASVEAPISMPGLDGEAVRVRPGDLVLGDFDGVVVIPHEHATQLIEDAERLQEIERTIREEIKAGATREEAFARNPRFAHIRAVGALTQF